MSKQNTLRSWGGTFKPLRRAMREHKKNLAAQHIHNFGVVLPRGAYSNLLYLIGKGLAR